MQQHSPNAVHGLTVFQARRTPTARRRQNRAGCHGVQHLHLCARKGEESRAGRLSEVHLVLAPRGDTPPTDEHAYLQEALATHATGLLAIALTHEQHSNDAVHAGAMAGFAGYLSAAVLGVRASDEGQTDRPSAPEAGAPSTAGAPGCAVDGCEARGALPPPAAADRHRDRAVASPSAAGSRQSAGAARKKDRTASGGRACASWQQAAVETRVNGVHGAHADGSGAFDDDGRWLPTADELRSRRERYCVQCMACIGEYLECLGPVLQVCRQTDEQKLGL
jgi:hypothetical protein